MRVMTRGAFLENPDRGSVRLDMSPGYGSDGLRGKIDLSSKTYQCTTNHVKKLTFPTSYGVTVKHVIDLVSRKGRQKYQFTEEEEGCRYWNYVFVSDLEHAGYIQAGSADTALDALSYYWVNPSGKEKRAVKKGTFRA